MKKEKKHGKENIIGKVIYAFLMFIPLLAIAITCSYAIFNKNAYKSYYGETINQEQLIDVTSNQEIESEKTYYFYGSNALNTDYSGTLYYTSCEYISGLINITTENIDFINNSVRLYYYRGTSITFYDNENNSLQMGGTGIVKLSGLLNNPTSTNTFRMIKEQQYNNLSFVSEVFYYSIDKVNQSPLFNWSKNTATYNVLETTCNTLGITAEFIPELLSYWLMMSLMYLLYDIALLVVHMAHNRIHDIESSI